MTRLITKIILLIIISVTRIASVLGQENDIAAVIKIANYTTWPGDKNEIRIAMAAKDDNSFKTAYNSIKNKTLGDKALSISMIAACGDTDLADIIYIEAGTSIDAEQIIQNANSGKLTISNLRENINLGCMFYINTEKDELEYLYNRQAVINSGLMIKSSLLSPQHNYDNQQ